MNFLKSSSQYAMIETPAKRVVMDIHQSVVAQKSKT